MEAYRPLLHEGGSDGIVLVPFVVEANYAGWRLDKYLCEKIRRLSRTRIQELIRRSLVAGVPLKPSTHVWTGLAFQLKKPAEAEPDVPSIAMLREVHVDAHLLVVDKPPGLPVHPSARYQRNTLTAQLKERYGFRAEPAHRLDRETSGLLICCRTALASRKLGIAFRDGCIAKEYLAIVEGWPSGDFEVDAPILEGTVLIRIAVQIAAGGRPAKTRFAVLRRFLRGGRRYALLQCTPTTGRQHQIRVHALHSGFPLVGDKIYSVDPACFDRFSKGLLTDADRNRLQLSRHALHAASLEFAHPETGKATSFCSPLPKDLAEFMDIPARTEQSWPA